MITMLVQVMVNDNNVGTGHGNDNIDLTTLLNTLHGLLPCKICVTCSAIERHV